MKDQVTTIEQSRRLMELGVPAEKASMEWFEAEKFQPWSREPVKTGEYQLSLKCWGHVVLPGDIVAPAFTVADLLEKVLPDTITTRNNMHVLTLGAMVDGDRWCVEYTPVLAELGAESIGDEIGGDLIALLCDRIEWFVSNGYKLEG